MPELVRGEKAYKPKKNQRPYTLFFMVASISIVILTPLGCARQVSLDEKLFRLNQLAMELLSMEDRLMDMAESVGGNLAEEVFSSRDSMEKLEREESKLKEIGEESRSLEPLPGHEEKISQLTIAELQTGQAIAAMRCFIYFRSSGVGSEPLYLSLESLWEECVAEARSSLDIFLGNSPDPYGAEEWHGWLLLEYFDAAKGFYPLFYWDLDANVFDTDKERLNEMLIYLRANLQKTLKDIYDQEVPDYWSVPSQLLKELVECMVGQSFRLVGLSWPIGEDQSDLVSMRYQLSGLVQNFFDELEARKMPRE